MAMRSADREGRIYLLHIFGWRPHRYDCWNVYTRQVDARMQAARIMPDETDWQWEIWVATGEPALTLTAAKKHVTHAFMTCVERSTRS